MALARDGLSRSEPGLVQLVREAATAVSGAGSAAASRRGRSGGSEGLYSQGSGGSGLSRSRSCASGSVAMSLKQMQSRVEDQAMERYKREIAKSAAAERSLLQNYEVKLKTNVNDEKLEADIKKSREIRNQNEIMQQIERNKDRRAHERREHIENASMHAYPLFSETFIDEAEVARIRKNQREQWREDLKHQMVTQDILKNIEEVRQRDLVQKQKTKHLVSMQRERGAEQQRLRRQGKELVAAWDKDLQLKSFRKAVLQGEQPPHTPGAPYA